MAIVEYLASLQKSELPPLHRICLDDFQKRTRQNTYLEIPQKDGSHCILNPHLQPVGSNSDDRIRELGRLKPDLLEYLKDRLFLTLIEETTTLETSTYFLEQNEYLLQARFKDYRPADDLLEIKLYTSLADDITLHYTDKIYIGRCFIKPATIGLPYDGLNLHVLSLLDQFDLLTGKAAGRLDNLEEYESSYFQEIRELLEDVTTEVITALNAVPAQFQPDKWTWDELVRTKRAYRGIVHLVIELMDEVGEFENIIRFRGQDDFAKYVTKYRQDLKNIVNYLNFKVLSTLSRKILKGS